MIPSGLATVLGAAPATVPSAAATAPIVPSPGVMALLEVTFSSEFERGFLDGNVLFWRLAVALVLLAGDTGVGWRVVRWRKLYYTTLPLITWAWRGALLARHLPYLRRLHGGRDGAAGLCGCDYCVFLAMVVLQMANGPELGLRGLLTSVLSGSHRCCSSVLWPPACEKGG